MNSTSALDSAYESNPRSRCGKGSYPGRSASGPVVPNAEMMGVFWMREEKTLYGRRTEVMLDGRAIGDIVEVLPLA